MFGHDFYGERCPTEREYRIIALIAQGLNNREIAREVGTTEHVLKNRLRVIYDKLGRWHRLEVALWYEEVRGSDERANACRRTGIGDLVTHSASVGPSTSDDREKPQSCPRSTRAPAATPKGPTSDLF